MILTAETHCHCTVFDANGVALKECLWCDTETGEAVHLYRDSEGRISRQSDDMGRGLLRKEWRQHPAPLTYQEAPVTKRSPA